MQPAFQKYLALYKKLDVPGIGNFTVEDTPPSLQFTDKQLLPPQSHIRFAPVVRPTNNHFYSFLSREWNVDKVIAIRRYKEEVESMMNELKRLGMYDCKGIGMLRRTSDDGLVFTAYNSSLSFFTALPAERVVRKYTQHTVLIGEQEHVKEYVMPDGDEEETSLAEEPAKDRWKLYALLLAIAAVAAIVIYYLFVQNG